MVVDGDERLDRFSWVVVELDLAVVQRLRVRMALLRERAELANVDGQRLVDELHELSKVEQRLQHLERHVVRIEGGFERAHDQIMVALHAELAPARKEGGVEELASERLVYLRERRARAQRSGRRAEDDLCGEAAHPLVVVGARRVLRHFPRRLEVLLVDKCRGGVANLRGAVARLGCAPLRVAERGGLIRVRVRLNVAVLVVERVENAALDTLRAAQLRVRQGRRRQRRPTRLVLAAKREACERVFQAVRWRQLAGRVTGWVTGWGTRGWRPAERHDELVEEGVADLQLLELRDHGRREHGEIGAKATEQCAECGEDVIALLLGRAAQHTHEPVEQLRRVLSQVEARAQPAEKPHGARARVARRVVLLAQPQHSRHDEVQVLL